MFIRKRAKQIAHKFNLFYKKYPSAASINWGIFAPTIWGILDSLGKSQLLSSKNE
jgi:hypothetical protein